MPYVNFCVSYDKISICNNLDNRFEKMDVYLEKIVQDSYHLLVPSKDVLMQFFDRRLDIDIVNSINDNPILQNRWADIILDLRALIDSPRKAKKLACNINQSYKRITSEVNPVEFICIEAIKLHDDNLYRLIYDYKNSLTNNDLHRDKNVKELIIKISELKNSSKNVAAVGLLNTLFPASERG